VNGKKRGEKENGAKGTEKGIDVKKRFFTFFILVTFFTFLTFFLFLYVFYF